MAKRKTKKFEMASFDIFWEEIYPRKEGKIAAEKKWKSLRLGALDLIPISKWIDRAILSEQWQETRFIPHPSTFLNQKRWVDSDPPPPAEVRRDAHANGEPRAEHGPLTPEAEAAIQAYQAKEKARYELQRRVSGKG